MADLSPPPEQLRPTLGDGAPRPAPLDAFAARLQMVDATFHHADSLPAARSLAAALIAGATVARFADAALDEIVPPDRIDDPAAAEVSLVLADLAIADTGQIGFAHGPGRPRAAALLPDRQIALVALEALVETVAEGLARAFSQAGGSPPPSLVLTAGPSRTADIEQRVIRGVHAPRTLDVIVFGS